MKQGTATSESVRVSICARCAKIITGQPSDRKSDGMYTYLHSTIFISPFSPVSLQKLMQLQSWRGSMAKWSGHWSCNPMISSVYRKLDWAVVVGSSEFSFLSTCKYLKIANQLGLSWNSFTYENIFLKISCHTDRATVKECDGQNPIVTPNSASYNHLGPFHKTGTPPGWPCWAKFGGGITQEITSFFGLYFFRFSRERLWGKVSHWTAYSLRLTSELSLFSCFSAGSVYSASEGKGKNCYQKENLKDCY